MPWTDYIIPVAIGACLLAVAVVGAVYTLIEKWLDLKEWGARWWYHQMDIAERRAATPKVRAPLLSINIQNRSVDYEEPAEPVPSSDFAPQDDPSTALDDRSSQTRTTRADGEAWTAEEILRQLATIKRVDKDGAAVYLSKEKMAALVNMRAEEARVIINEARGEPPPDALRVKDSAGERLIPRGA